MMVGRRQVRRRLVGELLSGFIKFFFGLLDACRKRTAPSQEPGEWVVISVDSTDDSVTVFVSVKNSGRVRI